MECPAQPAPPVAFRPGDPFPCPETRASDGHAVKRPGTGPRPLLRMPPGSESRDPLAAALEIARDHTGAPLSSPVGRDHPPTAFPIGSQGSGQRAPAPCPEDLGSCRHRSPGSPAAGGGVPRPTEPAVVSPDLHRVGPPGGSSPPAWIARPGFGSRWPLGQEPPGLPSAHRALHQEARLEGGVVCSPLFHAWQPRRGGGGNPLSATVRDTSRVSRPLERNNPFSQSAQLARTKGRFPPRI